jgi:hypothetical protein
MISIERSFAPLKMTSLLGHQPLVIFKTSMIAACAANAR